MSNNKQSSSIDFFWNQLPEILPFTVDTETAVKLLEAFEQAKAMHKEEIANTYDDAIEDVRQDEERPLKGLEYYNIHFKKNSI